MGSSRELDRSIEEARARSKNRHVRDGGVCVCDISVYVLHGRLPILGDVLPCSCRATRGMISALRSYLDCRFDEVREGAVWELDLSTFARLLKRTGAVLHWEPGLGALCLFSNEVTRSELTLLFRTDRLEVRSNGVLMPPHPQHSHSRIDKLIQESYISTLPTCRYLQYH